MSGGAPPDDTGGAERSTLAESGGVWSAERTPPGKPPPQRTPQRTADTPAAASLA